MNTKNQSTKPDLNEVIEINKKINYGNDPADFNNEDQTIPEIINHNSYGVATMIKPIVVLSDQQYKDNNDMVGKYYSHLSQLISTYNLTIFNQYTEYYVDKYINQVLQNIQSDIKKILGDNGLTSYNIDLYSALKDFHTKAYGIFIDNICAYQLNTIEGMAAEYIKDISNTDMTAVTVTGMDMIKQIFSPYLNAIVTTTVFELYNTVMKYIYNNLLYETTVENESSINLKKMNEIECQFTPIFNATSEFLFYNYTIMILNCFFSRTHQNHNDKSDFIEI